MKFKSVIINITIFFISCLLCFGILEIVFRTTHLLGARLSWSEPDPVLGYKFTPNKEYWHFKENDRPITGKINSYGWRDKEWTIEKPDNTYRIAILGDSFVEAFQVETERTFLALVEEKLNKNNETNFELMNFGISGATQTEELIILKNDVIKFSPDAVILFFLPGNDIEDVNKETAPNKLRPFYQIQNDNKLALDTSFVNNREYKIKALINPFKKNSALISIFCEKFNLYKQQKNKKDVDKRLSGTLSLYTNHPEPKYQNNYNLNKILIKKMVEYCKKKNIQFLLVTINLDAYISEKDEKYKVIDVSFDANYFDDDLNNFAKTLHIGHFGLQRIFSKYYKDTGNLLHWGEKDNQGHWNYEGHKVVADALTDGLSQIKYKTKE